MSWQDQAACRDARTELFFPNHSGMPAEAKALCDICPVRDECLDEALKDSPFDDFGIRGGTTADERYRMRRGKIRRSADMRRVEARPVVHSERTAGTRSGYTGGCRCDACTAAERDYKRQRQAS